MSVADLLEAAKSVVWRVLGEPMQLPWAAPKSGLLLLIDLWSGIGTSIFHSHWHIDIHSHQHNYIHRRIDRHRQFIGTSTSIGTSTYIGTSTDIGTSKLASYSCDFDFPFVEMCSNYIISLLKICIHKLSIFVVIFLYLKSTPSNFI